MYILYTKHTYIYIHIDGLVFTQERIELCMFIFPIRFYLQVFFNVESKLYTSILPWYKNARLV